MVLVFDSRFCMYNWFLYDQLYFIHQTVTFASNSLLLLTSAFVVVYKSNFHPCFQSSSPKKSILQNLLISRFC